MFVLGTLAVGITLGIRDDGGDVSPVAAAAGVVNPAVDGGDFSGFDDGGVPCYVAGEVARLMPL